MKSVTWEGDWAVTAGWRYSSGTLHASWDVAMPNGTRINSPVNGHIIDRVTGVPNVPGGSGSPSNWVLIGYTDEQGRKRCHYLQHLSKATCQPGQKVSVGDKVGESGNSGNSSGPHLHWTCQEGWQSAATRYNYLNNGGATAVYDPTKGEDEPMPTAKEIAKEVWATEIDLNPGGKPEMVTARAALRQAANQAEKAAGKPNAPSVTEIWAEILDKENQKSARALVRETWRKVTGRG